MDGNPLLRRAAARALSSHPSEEDVAALRTLLSDKDRSVEATAVRALGENKVEAARTELLVRARLGFPEVRAAALEAVGSMGGEFVLDALVLGATDADVQVRRASAKGLANLADPSATGFLVGLLGDGSDEEVRAAAREGVLKLGGRAVPELTRLLHQPGGRMRRDAALLLARLGSPDAVSPLLAILTQRRADAQVAEELAVLTCFDPRAQPEAVEAWWQWWEGVRHDDSLLWFRAGLERVGISTPPQGALEGEGTLQGRIFLTEVLARPEDLLVERARRELGRLLGREIGPLPPKGREREEYARKLREELRSTR
jgi:HEAT repeat protein